MNRLLLAIVPIVLAACASTPDTQTSEPREAKYYRTGSNIPVHDVDAGSVAKSSDLPTVRMPSQTRGIASGGG